MTLATVLMATSDHTHLPGTRIIKCSEGSRSGVRMGHSHSIVEVRGQLSFIGDIDTLYGNRNIPELT